MMQSISLSSCVIILVGIASGASSFSLHLTASRLSRRTSGSRKYGSDNSFCRDSYSSKNNNLVSLAGSFEDGDDGWGDDDNSQKQSVIRSQNEAEKRNQNKELARLQDDMAAKKNPIYSGGQQSVEGERDMFIPIFTLVSIIGFGGLYGYETLRLYLKGELYLPF